MRPLINRLDLKVLDESVYLRGKYFRIRCDIKWDLLSVCGQYIAMLPSDVHEQFGRLLCVDLTFSWRDVFCA